MERTGEKTRVFLLETQDWTESEMLRSLFSVCRKNKLASTHNSEVRRQSEAAELLLVYAAARFFRNGRVQAVEWIPGENGKPYLKEAPTHFFNITHTEGYAAVAASFQPVGVDIERVRPQREALARRILTETELSAYLREAEQDRPAAFAKKWVVKEAYAKLLGMGLQLPFAATEAAFGKVCAEHQQDGWYSFLPGLPQDIFAAVCSLQKAEIETEYLRSNELQRALTEALAHGGMLPD